MKFFTGERNPFTNRFIECLTAESFRIKKKTHDSQFNDAVISFILYRAYLTGKHHLKVLL